MLAHTKVFGDYRGPEDVINKTSCFTEINVIENYAPVRRATITVQNTDGQPLPDAKVEFKLYN